LQLFIAVLVAWLAMQIAGANEEIKIMTIEVFLWWLFLCAASGLNVLAWSLSALALERRRGDLHPQVFATRRLQILLSAGYVFGCAFRSALPVFDVPRMVLVDSWLSSVIVGRSVATIAELCFVAQWALLLAEISRGTDSLPAKLASRSLVPMIAIAEIFSWYSVLTTSNIGHIVEESLWGLCAASLVASLILVWPRCSVTVKPLLAALCMTGVLYVAFMFLVDVPMYWSRWIADEASGRSYFSIAQGISDASTRWVVSHRWEDWRSEVVWMSLYFSVAVWLSISLIHAPDLRRIGVAGKPAS
jgi:hypothetical protein